MFLFCIESIAFAWFSLTTLVTAEEILYKYKKNDKQLSDNVPVVIGETFRDSLWAPSIMASLYKQHKDKERALSE